MIQVTDTKHAGFRLCGLKSNDLEVSLFPELGARIVSLRHPRGREWMWSPDGTYRAFETARGSPFAGGPLCGLDECLPTIAPCHWRGRELPDHGEAWTETWTIDESLLSEGVLRTSLNLPISPLSLERTVSIDAATVRLDYALTNVGTEPYEYIWAMHPLFRIAAGDRLLLPPEVQTVRTDFAVNCDLSPPGREWNWSAQPLPLNLACLDFGTGPAAVKFFTSPLKEGQVRLHNTITGEYLVIEFNPAQIGMLGVWINRGGWGNYEHVALEPTNGAPDALDTAVDAWRRFARLEAGEVRAWSISMTVGGPESKPPLSEPFPL